MSALPLGGIPSGPVALFGLRFCKSFSIPLVEMVIFGIGRNLLGWGSGIESMSSVVNTDLTQSCGASHQMSCRYVHHSGLLLELASF